MNRTTAISSLVFTVLLLAPAPSFAAVSPAQPIAPVDTIQSLTSELATIAESLNSLASSTATITISNSDTSYGLDSRTGNELKITNVGLYHTVVPYNSTVPSIELSKLIFQYIPCVASSPIACASSQSYPPVTSELGLNQSTTYLNYDIKLTAMSSTSATLQVTDTTEFTNIQNELSSISTRISKLLGKSI